MERGGCVYIMTNKTNSVLYIGVSSELENRVWQHKNCVYPKSFTSKYKCYKLVYYELFAEIEEAIAEEKRIKAGSRQAKLDLINASNPSWDDLCELLN